MNAIAQIIETTGTTVAPSTLALNASLAAKTAAARARLEQVVAEGAQKTAPVIERVLNELPEDRLVTARAAGFKVGEKGPEMVGGRLGSHAFGQLVTRAGMPVAYANKLAAGETWEKELLEHAMGRHLENTADRYLVRSVNGQVRGVLSDSYRRMDSRPLLDAFVSAVTALGGIPYEGVATEVRASVRAVIPRVFEPVPGEAMVFGLAWNNSDFGAGAFGISAFVLRLICLNGAVGASELKKVHLGARLDDISISQRTHDLDAKTLISATRDLVRGSLSEGAITRKLDAVKKAHATETDWTKAWRSVSSKLTKGEGEKVREAFEGPDVVMLPAGNTAWRFSNALSWVANGTEDAERKLELQSLAGGFLG